MKESKYWLKYLEDIQYKGDSKVIETCPEKT
jgi:hypothetical protein